MSILHRFNLTGRCKPAGDLFCIKRHIWRALWGVRELSVASKCPVHPSIDLVKLSSWSWTRKRDGGKSQEKVTISGDWCFNFKDFIQCTFKDSFFSGWFILTSWQGDDNYINKDWLGICSMSILYLAMNQPGYWCARVSCFIVGQTHVVHFSACSF